MPARSGGSEIAGAHECIAWLILVLVATTNPKDQYCNRRHRIDFRNQLTQHVPREAHGREGIVTCPDPYSTYRHNLLTLTARTPKRGYLITPPSVVYGIAALS